MTITNLKQVEGEIEWNPGYWKYSVKESGKVWHEYPKLWYCNTNKMVHQSLSEVVRCPHCCKLRASSVEKALRMIKNGRRKESRKY